MATVKIFWQPACSVCPVAKALGEKLEAEGADVKYYNVKEPSGLSEAVYYGLMATPVIVVADGNGKEIAKWDSEVPSVKEVKEKL